MALLGRTRRTRLLVVVLVSISLLTITVDFRQGTAGPLAAAGRAALGLIGPLQEAVTRVTRPVGDFFAAVWRLPSLADDNEQLRRRVEELEIELAGSDSLRERYDQAIEVLHLKKSLKPDSAAALVVAGGISNTEWVITINKGTDDDLAEGMPVVSAGGALVGHVVRAAADFSDVQLIIDVDSRVTSRLINSRQTGILAGMGDADLRMELLDPAADVTVDEPVETAGYCGPGNERGLYPPAILIGTVSRVVEDPAALEKFVTVRPAADFTSLETVLVLKTDPEGPCGGRSR